MDINNNLPPAAVNSNVQADLKTPAPRGEAQQSATSVVSPAMKTQLETPKAIADQADQLNQQLAQLGQSLAFSVDENTQSTVVKIVDKTTDEVIKQFPSEGSLKIMQNIQNYLNTVQQSGLPTKEGLTGTLFNEII
ncbi:MAG: flagellar protein FlaG [Thiomicrorhabdus chilensis]|uniref:flagellar protein FlaG n=1 Tax=Thiomicrorhabdus chilensis TaxID=63656 RepID=UPI00299F00BE|nr:flagellar protein FlaG [Thiomicrorhabdus chilensis]MDX1346913.1 flagellar protein FlaG [Thiomicrorhabdus chilensis]